MILKERPKNWNQHIPGDKLKKLEGKFRKLFGWNSPKPSPNRIKMFLLMGVSVDTNHSDYDKGAIISCIDDDYLDIAEIRND
jgi:hypothetical protein